METPSRSAPTIDELLAHAGWLRRLARRLVANPESAEDVVQGTWLRALESPPTSLRSARAWLARVARRLASESGRADDARRRREERHARVDPAAGAGAIVAAAQQHRLLVREVMALNEPYRSTLLLRFFEGRSAAAIAAAEGVPSSTVRNRLRRALAQLRDRLDVRAGGDRAHWQSALLPLAGLARTSMDAGPRIGALVMSTSAKVVTVSLLVVAAFPFVLHAWTDSIDAPAAETFSAEPPLSEPGPSARALAGVPPQPAARLPAEEPAPPPQDASPEPAEPAPPLPVAAGRVLLAQQTRGVWLPRDEEVLESVSRSMPLDRGGVARFAGVDPGSYTVGVKLAAGFLQQALVDVPESEGARLVIELGAASLVGHVYRPDGEPVTGARVQASIRRVHSIVWTDPDGAYGLLHLPSGPCRVSVDFSGWQNAMGSEFGLQFELGPGERRELDFGDADGWPIWRGMVRAADGEPVVNYVSIGHTGEFHLIRAKDGNYSHVAYGADGSFELRLAPGAYDVSLTAPSNQERSSVDDAFEVPPEDVERDVTLAGAIVTGRVQLAGGEAPEQRPVGHSPHMVIVCRERHAYPVWRAPIDREGGFRVDGVGAGEWWLCATVGDESAAVSLTITERDRVVSMDLALAPD